MVRATQPYLPGYVTGTSVLAMRAFAKQLNVMETLQAALPEDVSNQLLHAPCRHDERVQEQAFMMVMLTFVRVTGMPMPQFMLQFGTFMFPFLIKQAGYEQFLHRVSATLLGFARCLTQLLQQVYVALANIRSPLPEIQVTGISPDSFAIGLFALDMAHLERTGGILALMQGMLSWVSSNVFGFEITFAPVEVAPLSTGQLYQSCRVIAPSPVPNAFALAKGSQPAPSSCMRHVNGLDPETFAKLFPWHFSVDLNFRLLQAGQGLQKMLPQLAQPGIHIGEVLTVQQPQVQWSMDCLRGILENDMVVRVVLSSHSGLDLCGGLHRVQQMRRAGNSWTMDGEDALMFIGAPYLQSADELERLDLCLSDFGPHDLLVHHVLMAASKQAMATAALREAQDDNSALKETLAEALATQQQEAGVSKLSVDSAGHVVLKVLDRLIMGEQVGAQALLAARSTLLKAGNNLWKPLSVHWSQAMVSDEEVNESLAKLLGTTGVRGSVDKDMASWDLPHGGSSSANSALHMPPGHDLPSSLQRSQTHHPVLRGPGASPCMSGRGPESDMRSPPPSSSTVPFPFQDQAHEVCRPLDEPHAQAGAQQRAHGRGGDGNGGGATADTPVVRDRQVAGASCFDSGGSRTDLAAAAAAQPGGVMHSVQLSLESLDAEAVYTSSSLCGEAGGQRSWRLAAVGPSDAEATTSSSAPASEPWWKAALKPFRTLKRSSSGSSGSSGGSGSSTRLKSLLWNPGDTCDEPHPLDYAAGVLLGQPAAHSPVEAACDLPADSLTSHFPAKAKVHWAHGKEQQGASAHQRGPRKSFSSGTMPACTIEDRHAVPLVLLQHPSDKAVALLAHVDEWQFDSFALEEATGGRPLSFLGFYLMQKMGIVQRLKLDPHKLARFLMHIEDGYAAPSPLPGDAIDAAAGGCKEGQLQSNPYHNRMHAADVLRSLHALLLRGGLQDTLIRRKAVPAPTQRQLDGSAEEDSGVDASLQLLTCYLAAIIHDYEHRGVNNDFLCKSTDPLALLYNDMSPMEMHHVSSAFQLMHQDQFAFMRAASKKVRAHVRRNVVELVLATDMKQHFAITTSFLHKLANRPQHDGGQLSGSSHQGSNGNSTSGRGQQAQGGLEEEVWDEETEVLVLKVALKAADLGHLTSSIEVHERWVARLEEELFRQGDREKALGQPISPLMDRTKAGITKSQCGFFRVVAEPMFTSLAHVFPQSAALLTNLQENLRHWALVEEAGHA